MPPSNQNLADLAFILAAIFCFVVKYAPNDVMTEVNDSKIIFLLNSLLIEFRKDFPDLKPSSPTIV